MKTFVKILAVSLFGAGFVVSACSSDDTEAPALPGSTTGTTGDGGPAADGGTTSTSSSTGGATAGSTGTTATAGTSTGAGSTSTSTGGTSTGGTGTGTGDASVEASAGEGGPKDAASDASAPPTLGAQIDRIGRPAINTALTAPFSTGTAHDMATDAYNAEADPAMWSPKFKSEIRANLAIYDALDSNASTNGCGNQFAIGPASDGGTGDAGTNRYDPLATVLVDDRLYVNTKIGDSGIVTCGQYLAVEANATGTVPNQDCGGRTLRYDVIDTTYSLLAVGTATGVTDGVMLSSPITDTFPFVAPPQ
jgi:hypothetical protein